MSMKTMKCTKDRYMRVATIVIAILVILGLVAIFEAANDGSEEAQTIEVEKELSAFEHFATVRIGGEGAAEIVSYDKDSNTIFVIQGDENKVLAYPLTATGVGNIAGEITVASGGINSISVSNGKIALAVEADVKQEPGQVVVYNTTDLSKIVNVTVGALPDMITFTPDGDYILVANEGEPNDDYTVDPEGSVSLIDVNNDYSVTSMNFSGFEAPASSEYFKLDGANEPTLSEDVEPEYIAVSSDSTIAWVALQENNGIAVVDIVSKSITALHGLGVKNFNVSGNKMDGTDEERLDRGDAQIVLKNYPIYGLYQPDGIAVYEVNGTSYLLTANEGDGRTYPDDDIDGLDEGEAHEDLINIVNLNLSSAAFPNTAFVDELDGLEVFKSMGLNEQDEYEMLVMPGARSFSIWNTTDFSLVYDSGDDLAIKSSSAMSDISILDSRNDRKGSEPEGVTVGKIGSKTYAFVGLERASLVMVYDITVPTETKHIQTLSYTDDVAPEGILFIPADESPVGAPLLLAANEHSGTLTLYKALYA